MYKFVRFFAYTTDTFLLIVMFVLIFRLMFLASPKFDESEFSKKVDQIFSPFTSVMKIFSEKTGVPLTIKGFNLALVPVFILVIICRNLLNLQLSRIVKKYVDTTVEKKPFGRAAPAGETKVEKVRRKTTERRLAIQTYTEVKEILESSQQDLTFVALDVVGSTKMKIGEDPIIIEQTFYDYRKLVETLLQRFQVYKCTWTPDGQMAAFKTPDLGVLFAKAVLGALPEFNQKSKLKTPFKLRVGVNSGVVSTDDATPMEKLSSFSIDLTGHLQKYAEPDSMWVSEKIFNSVSEKDGFVSSATKVDDNNVFTWRIP